jgi:U3 small nucleolar ribonucleoprotein component
LEKDLAVMLTQDDLDEEQREEKERLLKEKKNKKRMMKPMTMRTQKRDMKVLRILSHMNPDIGQQRMSWIRILTRTRRYRESLSSL